MSICLVALMGVPGVKGECLSPLGSWMRLDDTEVWEVEQILGHHDMILTSFKRNRVNEAKGGLF